MIERNHSKKVGNKMAINSREKGKRAEREAAALIREYGYDARRGVQYAGGPDSPDVVGLPGVHLEIKHVERLNLLAAMDQSADDSAPDELPVVMHRKNRSPWLVTMWFEDFMDLYERGKNDKNGNS